MLGASSRATVDRLQVDTAATRQELGLHLSSTVAGERLPSCLYAIGDGRGIRALPLGLHSAGVVAIHPLTPSSRGALLLVVQDERSKRARALTNTGVVR